MILYCIVNTELKVSVVERFNRTLIERMFRYFKFVLNKRYIDVLDDIMGSYNNTYHRTIKTKPSNVTYKNKDIIKAIYKPKFKFQVDDYMRISKYKTKAIRQMKFL